MTFNYRSQSGNKTKFSQPTPPELEANYQQGPAQSKSRRLLVAMCASGTAVSVGTVGLFGNRGIERKERPPHRAIGKTLEIAAAGPRRGNAKTRFQDWIISAAMSDRRFDPDYRKRLRHDSLATNLPQVKRRRLLRCEENCDSAMADDRARPHLNPHAAHRRQMALPIFQFESTVAARDQLHFEGKRRIGESAFLASNEQSLRFSFRHIAQGANGSWIIDDDGRPLDAALQQRTQDGRRIPRRSAANVVGRLDKCHGRLTARHSRALSA